MKVDGLLFDKDGTLFLFEASWESWAHASFLRLAQGDRARAQILGASVGFDMGTLKFSPDSIVIAGTPDEVTQVLAAQLALPSYEIEAILNEEAALAQQVEATDLVPFLNDLRAKGLKLGVATNDAEQPARAHLATAGVLEMFDFIAGYDSGHGAKPAPGPCQAFARHVGLAPAKIAMVGDSLHDLRAGRAAGMQTVAVLTGIASAAELAPYADVVLPDISHLTQWLSQP